MAHDIFISYSSKDKTVADAICATLEQNNVKCWYAPRDVPAGKNYSGEITRSIKNCKIFILVFSSHSNLSRDVLNEVKISFENNLVIIPFKIEKTQLSDDLQYFMGNPHWLDAISPPIEIHLKKLLVQVSQNLNKQIKDIRIISPKKKKIPNIIIWPVLITLWGIIFFLIWHKYFKPDYTTHKEPASTYIESIQKPEVKKTTTINNNRIEVDFKEIELDYFLNREVYFQGKRLRFEQFWNMFINSSKADGLTVDDPECFAQYSNFIIRYHISGTSKDGKVWDENADFEVNSMAKHFKPVSSLATTLTNVLDE